MQGNKGGSRTVRVSQLHETPTQTIKQPDYAMRYAYARSSESRRFNSSGQDYITLYSGRDGLTFVLCDGVGQSFHGELAASFLGEKLAEWLWQNGARYGGNEAALQKALYQYLESLTGEATRLVDGYEVQPGQGKIAASTTAIYQEALQESRSNGSETTFAGGFITLPNPKFPNGLLVLTWMGDSPIRLWGRSGERSSEIAGQFHTGEHWSTRYGLSNRKPHVFFDNLQNVQRLLVTSDGLTAVQPQLGQKLSPEHLNQLIKQVAGTGNSDDLSLVDLELAPQIIRAVTRPAFTNVSTRAREINVMWGALADVDSYEISAVIDSVPVVSQKKMTSTTWRWTGSQAWEACEIQLRARKGDDVSEESLLALHQEMELVGVPIKNFTKKLALLGVLIFLIIILSFIAGIEYKDDIGAAGKFFQREETPAEQQTPAPQQTNTPEASSGAALPVVGSFDDRFASLSDLMGDGLLAEMGVGYPAGSRDCRGAL